MDKIEKMMLSAIKKNPKIKIGALSKVVGKKVDDKLFYKVRDHVNFGFARDEGIAFIKGNPGVSFGNFLEAKKGAFKKCPQYKFYDLRKAAIGVTAVSNKTPATKSGNPKQVFVYGNLGLRGKTNPRALVESVISMLGVKVQIVDLADGSVELRSNSKAL